MKKINILIFCSSLFCNSIYAQDSVTKTITSLFNKNKQIQQDKKQIEDKKPKNMFISQEKMQEIKNQCELESDTEIEMQKCIQSLVKKELSTKKELNHTNSQKKLNLQKLSNDKANNKKTTNQKSKIKNNLTTKKRKSGPVVETVINPNASNIAKKLYKKEIERNKEIERLKKF